MEILLDARSRGVHWGQNMAVDIAINEELLTAAHNISGLKTKAETNNLALEEFVKSRRRKEAIKLFGQIDFCTDWTPRKARGKV